MIRMTEKDRIYRKIKTLISEEGDRKSYIGEDDFVCLSKNGITINYHIRNRNLEIETIFRAVKRAQRIVSDRFDHFIEKFEIDIFDSLEDLRRDGRSKSRYASWIAGIFDGKIRLISERDNDEPEALYIILTHEIIHLAVYEISKGKCPYWLDEGVAVYLSQELSDTYQERLLRAVKNNRVFPLECLGTPLPPDIDEDSRQLAYAQCASLSEYMTANNGWEAVKSMVSQSATKSIEMILADGSLNYYLLEQAWKRWLILGTA